MRTLNVLVVDDEPINCEVAEMMLDSFGFSSTVCKNGAEVLQLCVEEGRRFDLILMDVFMPVMDGLEATRRLRTHPAHGDVPILCISAKPSAAIQQEALSAGCDHFLNKPYKRSDLLRAISETQAKRGVEPSESPLR